MKNLTLTAEVSSDIKNFIQDKKLVESLVNSFGSPLNIVFPKQIKRNYSSFKKVCESNEVMCRLFYAHKTNKSLALLRSARQAGASLDVASFEELKDALAAGFSEERIEATGPKSDEFLSLAILQDVTLNVDSLYELARIHELKGALKVTTKTRILVRLSNFSSTHTHFIKKQSRFGINIDDIESCLAFLEKYINSFDFLGFSFHLDTVNIQEKLIAIEEILKLLPRLPEYGLKCRVLNIGGGMKANYLENSDEWDNYVSALKDSLLGKEGSLTWNNQSFGLRNGGGKISGSLNTYQYYDNLTGSLYLEELLKSKIWDSTVGNLLKDNLLELWIEPGRSMVNQSGITIARVIGEKTSSQGDILILLDMKRNDVAFLDQEIFVDPILVKTNKNYTKNPKGCYLLGNLCLETDIIMRHKIFLEQKPQKGDLLIFPNTAGYMMDFSATSSIKQKIAYKIAAYIKKKEYLWTLDENYFPELNQL